MRSNAIAVPPRAGFAASATCNDARRRLKRAKIVAHAFEPRRVDVERDQIERRKLRQMRRLAARRGARVEHAHAVTRVQQRRGELRAGVLHRKPAVRIARQLVDRARSRDDHAGVADALAPIAAGRQAREYSSRDDCAAIDAQRQRRPRVARIENRRLRRRILREDAIDPPARIRKARFGLARSRPSNASRRRRNVRRIALVRPLRRRALEPRRRAHRAVDDRVRGRAGVDQLIERDPEQRFDARVGQRALGEQRTMRAAGPGSAACRTRARGRARARPDGTRRIAPAPPEARLRRGPDGRFSPRCAAHAPSRRRAASLQRASASRRWIALLGRRVRAEQSGEPPPCSGLTIIICAVAGCSSAGSSGTPLRVAIDLRQRICERSRIAGNLGAAAIGFVFASARNGELDQHARRSARGSAPESPGADCDDRRRCAAEEHAEMRERRDRAGDRRGDRRREYVAIPDVRELVCEHAAELPCVSN